MAASMASALARAYMNIARILDAAAVACLARKHGSRFFHPLEDTASLVGRSGEDGQGKAEGGLDGTWKQCIP